MLLIWQGFGFLVVIIPLFVTLIGSLLGGVLGASNLIVFPLTLLASAMAVFYFGKQLNSRPGKILIDPETQQTVELRKRHTLFWIPMQYWAFPLGVLGFVMLLGNLVA